MVSVVESSAFSAVAQNLEAAVKCVPNSGYPWGPHVGAELHLKSRLRSVTAYAQVHPKDWPLEDFHDNVKLIPNRRDWVAAVRAHCIP